MPAKPKRKPTVSTAHPPLAKRLRATAADEDAKVDVIPSDCYSPRSCRVQSCPSCAPSASNDTAGRLAVRRTRADKDQEAARLLVECILENRQNWCTRLSEPLADVMPTDLLKLIADYCAPDSLDVGPRRPTDWLVDDRRRIITIPTFVETFKWKAILGRWPVSLFPSWTIKIVDRSCDIVAAEASTWHVVVGNHSRRHRQFAFGIARATASLSPESFWYDHRVLLSDGNLGPVGALDPRPYLSGLSKVVVLLSDGNLGPIGALNPQPYLSGLSNLPDFRSITVKADVTAGTLSFVVDGVDHGPARFRDTPISNLGTWYPFLAVYIDSDW